MFRTLQIAWRNMGRNKKRTGLALLAIAVGQFALLATNGLMHGYVDNIRLAITGPMIGHVQVHATQWREERALDLHISDVNQAIQRIQTDPAVKNATARIYAPVLMAPQEDAFMAVVAGIQVDIESQPYGLLSGMQDSLEPGKVLIGHLLAQKTKARIGQEIAVIGQAADGSLANELFVIQDIIKCPADLINQSGIIVALEDAQALFVMPDQAHEIVVRAHTSGQAQAIAERLSDDTALGSLEILPWQAIVPELMIILDTAGWVGYFVLVLVFIAAVAGIANTLMMSTFERIHEFGMLLALGCGPMRIVRMIVLEALLVGLAGALLGTLLGYGFTQATCDSGVDMASWAGDGENQADNMAYKGLNIPLHIYPRLEPGDSLLGLTAVLLTSLIASIWPAWTGARLEPMEAMRA